MAPLTYKTKKMTGANPYDFGEEALYGAGGYQGTPSPVYDWGSLFSGNGPGAPPGGSTSGRGNAYADLINRMLTQQRSDFAGDSAADRAGMEGQIKRMLVSYGAVPDVAGIGGEAQGVLKGLLGDQKLVDLINQNTAEGTSVKARQEQANALAQQGIGQRQAASGRLHSGDTGWRQGQQEMAHKQTAFDTLNQLLGEAEGSVGGFAANERARQRALADAENQAAMAMFNFTEDTDLGGYGGGGGDGLAGAGPAGGTGEGTSQYPWVQEAYNQQMAQKQAQARARAAAAARAKAEAARRAKQYSPTAGNFYGRK